MNLKKYKSNVYLQLLLKRRRQKIMKNIRNFCIIAHIDHGKSTLADRLLEYTEKLRKHPARDGYGTNADYPIEWTCLQGGIFHPYCLKYHDRLLKDKALMPSFQDYR